MTTVPNPKTWADRDQPDWKELGEEIFDTLDFLFNPPMCYVKANSSTSIVNNAWTSMVMGEVLADMPGTQAMFSTAQPTRVTPKTAGRYKILYGASWDNVACGCSGTRMAHIYKNGTAIMGRMDERPASSTVAHKVSEGHIAFETFNGTTDYIELRQWTSGGTVNNGSETEDWQSAIYVRWVAAN